MTRGVRECAGVRLSQLRIRQNKIAQTLKNKGKPEGKPEQIQDTHSSVCIDLGASDNFS